MAGWCVAWGSMKEELPKTALPATATEKENRRQKSRGAEQQESRGGGRKGKQVKSVVEVVVTVAHQAHQAPLLI